MTLGAMRTIMRCYGYTREHARLIINISVPHWEINNNLNVHHLRLRNIFRDFPVRGGLSQGE